MQTLQVPFWLLKNKKLTSTAKLVYAYIRQKKPSRLKHEDIAGISEALSVSERAVEMALGELVDQGLITFSK